MKCIFPGLCISCGNNHLNLDKVIAPFLASVKCQLSISSCYTHFFLGSRRDIWNTWNTFYFEMWIVTLWIDLPYYVPVISPKYLLHLVNNSWLILYTYITFQIKLLTSSKPRGNDQSLYLITVHSYSIFSFSFDKTIECFNSHAASSRSIQSHGLSRRVREDSYF